MSEIGWSDLPVLPLGRILRQLSISDVMRASATCHSWRDNLILCNISIDKLKLYATSVEKNRFLTKLFLKNAKKLLLHVDCNNELQINEFMETVLSKSSDARKLEDIVIFGPSFLKLIAFSSPFKINNEPVYNLLQAHKDKLKSYALLGCKLIRNDAVTAPMPNQSGKRPASSITCIQHECTFLPPELEIFEYDKLRHICVEYEMLSAAILNELTKLKVFSHLSIIITNKRNQKFEKLPWKVFDKERGFALNEVYVTLNIIGVPAKKFEDIMQNVMVKHLPLYALRVFFCKTFQETMLHHIAEHYPMTLREVQWVDAHSEIKPKSKIINLGTVRPFYNEVSVNPLILICWQCKKLSKIVLHGYWLWQYDMLGMARLRYASLRHFEVSATYQKDLSSPIPDSMTILPVFIGKSERTVDPIFIKQMNEVLQFKWIPSKPWDQLHPALGPSPDETMKADYVRNEILTPYGIT